MSEAEQQLFMLKGMIGDLKPEEQTKFNASLHSLRNQLEAGGIEFFLALSVVTLEQVIKNEK